MANVVIVGPHPDDQELGMGGTAALMASQGHRVLLVDMTNGEPTPMGDARTREKEARAALGVLNEAARGAARGKFEAMRRVCLGLPNRTLEISVGARHALAKVYREWGAEVVFAPHFEDAHPDHVATARIAEDARFDAKLTGLGRMWRGGEIGEVVAERRGVDTPGREWFAEAPEDGKAAPVYPRWFFYYYCTHLRRVADPGFCVDITGFEGAKENAIRAYETQFVRPEKNAKVVEWVRAAGVYFGSRIGTGAAEPFFSKEPVGLRGLELVGL